MQAPLPLPDLDSPPSSSSPPRPRRPPPPGHYNWQPFAIEYKALLPVLPPIRDLALAAQARTTKQYLAWQDGRKGTHDFTDEDEARSFRRLEWVGDGVLHDLYAVALYCLFPRAKSDLLSRMRGAVASNNVHSYLGWQYRLDERILEPPVAAGGKLARPFREVQVYSADLLEAHIGALVVEGRRAEVEDWVAELFSSASVEIEAAVEAFDSPHAKGGSRANKKRVASQPGFQNGTDMDPVTRTRRISHIADCRSTTEGALTWEDRIDDEDSQWHCHLLARDGDEAHTLGCGAARSRQEARERAILDLGKSVRSHGLSSAEAAALFDLFLLSGSA